MGGQLSIDSSVHVVIVGGGFGGIAAAQHLKHHGVPFMLIDPLDAFHHNVAALRASVQSGMSTGRARPVSFCSPQFSTYTILVFFAGLNLHIFTM